ncbi:MAG: hypothetical protein NT178_13455 [Proteobacteria bacterium]|nr:hypothetical protein [Pseudomonadota bacterium]
MKISSFNGLESSFLGSFIILFISDFILMNYPAAELKCISGMRIMIVPPHAILSHEWRGNMVTPISLLYEPSSLIKT